jgi:multicomponent Na+:H+ antiporter subunit D
MSLLAAHWPILVVVVPIATAPLAALLRDRNLAWIAAAAASLVTFALSIGIATTLADAPLSYAVGGWLPPYGIELRVDAFAVLLLLIVTGASSAALLLARGAVPPDRAHLFFAAWLLALAGLCGIVVAGDAFNIFVFMEISSLATYTIIAGGTDRRALTAVFKYLVLGTIGATFYLIGVGFLYMVTGTLNLADMTARLNGVADLRPVLAGGAFITVGLALKAAVFPLHTWLPAAYTHAPHAVTAFIAPCSTKVALYVLLIFQFSVLPDRPGGEIQLATLMLPLAALAMIVASAVAVRERDVKRLLAYSSVAQIGYIVLGAGLGSTKALGGAIVHMFNHALAKGTLFMAVALLAGAAALSTGSIAGAARRAPVTMGAFVVAALSLIGLPGTAGFIGKWELVVAAVELGPLGVAATIPLLVSSLLAVIYVWKIIEPAYFRAAGPETLSGESSIAAVGLLVLAAGANVYFGLQPQVPLGFAEQAAAELSGAAELVRDKHAAAP